MKWPSKPIGTHIESVFQSLEKPMSKNKSAQRVSCHARAKKQKPGKERKKVNEQGEYRRSLCRLHAFLNLFWNPTAISL
jgi:hypothetical protein